VRNTEEREREERGEEGHGGGEGTKSSKPPFTYHSGVYYFLVNIGIIINFGKIG